MVWRSRRSFLAVLLALFLSPIMFFMMDRAEVIIVDLMETNRFIKKSHKHDAEQEKGRGCNVPQHGLFTEDIGRVPENIARVPEDIARVPEVIAMVPEDIARLPEDLPVVTCEGTDWVNCYKSECSIAIAIQKTVKEIVCNYQDIVYLNARNVYIGHPTKVIGDEKYALNKSDLVKIDCTGKNLNSPDVRAHWFGYKAGFRPVRTIPIPSERKDSYNVLILCFDSTSRNGFIRRMRNSYKYLTEQLNAVVLDSYNNIVGDGTTAALYPLLTGKSEEELTYQRKGAKRKKFIDSKKFIFHMLKEYGYRTAYFEDMPRTGTAQHRFNRFRRPPADHYFRISLFNDIDQGENRYQGRPSTQCFGAMPQHQLMMNLADEFLQLDGKKFCFTLVADVKNENFTVLPSADETLLSFLKNLTARRALDDTLVLVMGDHQSRLSSIRKTSQGRNLERLQLMAILLPEKLKIRRSTALSSLENNKDVLTTPFNIHATILDVLDLKEKNRTRKIPGYDLLRVMTLLEPIPRSRTCGEVGVSHCTCNE